MAELLEAYTAAVARAVERLLSAAAPRRVLPRRVRVPRPPEPPLRDPTGCCAAAAAAPRRRRHRRPYPLMICCGVVAS